MDQNVILGVKTKYKRKTLLDVLSIDGNFSEAIRKMTTKDAIFRAFEAWDEVSPATKSSWKKVWPSCPISSQEEPEQWAPEDETLGSS